MSALIWRAHTLSRHPLAPLAIGGPVSLSKWVFPGTEALWHTGLCLYISLVASWILHHAGCRRGSRGLSIAYALCALAYAFVPFVEAHRLAGAGLPHGVLLLSWFFVALGGWIPITLISLAANVPSIYRRFTPIVFAGLGTLDVGWFGASI